MRVAQVLRELGELAFPPRCQICDRFSRAPVCDSCAASFEPIGAPLCGRCGCPFDPKGRAGPLCADCAFRSGTFTAARSFGLHIGGLRQAVNAFKFHGRSRLAEPLGACLVRLLQAEAPVAPPFAEPPDGLVPVPLHPTRRRERGFDQAQRLAAVLSQATGIPVREHLLTRTRHTRPQVDLKPAERRENVRGAFALRHPLPRSGVRVLLVDDVYTTGSTLEECARTLRKGGAGEVYAVTVTRAAPEWHPSVDLADAV